MDTSGFRVKGRLEYVPNAKVLIGTDPDDLKNFRKKRRKNSDWRSKNLEHARKLSREWHHKNRDRSLINGRRWRERNPEKYKKAIDAWNKKNPEWRKKYYRRVGVILKDYKRSAKKRNIKWEMVDKEFFEFWNKSCYYCGKQIETIGLDRVDNSAGYIKSNVVPCCTKCNRAKDTMLQKEFLDMVRSIVRTHGSEDVTQGKVGDRGAACTK